MGFTLAAPFRQIKRQKFGGLYTEIPPPDLPEGLSPLVHDCDLTIQSVNIRPGQRRAINFGSDNTSAYAGAASQMGSGTAWSNPANIIGPPDGQVASVTVPASVNVNSGANLVTAPAQWTNPNNLIGNSGFASYMVGGGTTNYPYGAIISGMSLGLPLSAQIVGIEVNYNGYQTATGGTAGQVGAALGTISGSSFTLLSNQQLSAPPGTSAGNIPIGSATDTWMYPFTPGILNGPNFAVYLWMVGGLGGPTNLTTFNLNDFSITVYYQTPSSSQTLIASSYGFVITDGRQISGIEVDLTAYQSGSGTAQVQLTWNGALIGLPKTVTFPSSSGLVPLGGPMDGWSAGLSASQAESTSFGMAITGSNGTFNVDAALIKLTLTQPNAPAINWLKSFLCPGPGQLTLALDSEGTLWQELVNSDPGIMNSFYDGITAGSKVVAQNTAERCFLALSDLINATDQPRQYNGANLDRISQVGPGAGPQIVVDTTTYNINPSPNGLYNPNPQKTVSTLDWSNGNLPGDAGPGNVVSLGGVNGDLTFTIGLSIGDPIYVSGFTGGLTVLNGTWIVTALPLINNTQFVQFIGPKVDQVALNLTGQYYQKTSALVSLANPIPNGYAQIGTNLTVAGAGSSDWDATYTIVGTPAQGQLGISATSLTSHVATYTYSLISGVAPGWQPAEVVVLGQLIADPNTPGQIWQVTTAGTTGGTLPAFTGSTQTDNTVTWTKITNASILVTVFNTSNGDGIFNATSATILTANQTTFTVTINSPNVSSSAEQGSAFSGQGNLFEIDPGLAVVGTATSPIYAASGGGTVVVAGSISSGQRYAFCMYFTRNGFWTPASPPIPFYTSESAVALRFTNLPIGPPNVIARGIAITAASPDNSNIGGPYYVIEEDVSVPNLATGVTETYNKTVINDNVTTFTGALNFSDTILLTGQNVTEQGNNALQKRELGACGGCIQYSGRMFYWREQTKIDNLVNMTFDGGYLSGSPTFPAGWSVDQAIGPLLSLPASAIFGNSLLIHNQTGSTFNTAAPYSTLNQAAYQDAFQAPIIDPNTAYSARITARIPSGVTSGSFVVELHSPSQGSWDATLPFSRMTGDFAIFVVPFNNPLWQSVPTDLLVRIYPLSMVYESDVEIDRIDIFPSNYPVYTTQLAVSYDDSDFESIDGVTGILDVSRKNPQGVTSAFVLFDTLYVAKTGSTVSTEDNDSTEPAGWEVKDVTQGVGALGAYAVDMAQADSNGEGEDYALIASYSGLYLFNGGNHLKLSQEIQTMWNAMYAPSLQTVWVKNDQINKRILVGIPLPTPNQWLPDAPTNATPAQPNVILAIRYLGADSPEALADSPPAHVSVFSGAMLARDLTRKWNPWQIQTQIFDWIVRPNGGTEQWLGGAAGTGAIFALDPTVLNDNGAVIPQTYTTDGLNDPQVNDALQIGSVRKLYGYATLTVSGAGQLAISCFPETLETPYVDELVPVTLGNPALGDANVPLNETGNRLFLQFSVDTLNSWFSLNRLVVGVMDDPRIPISGI